MRIMLETGGTAYDDPSALFQPDMETQSCVPIEVKRRALPVNRGRLYLGGTILETLYVKPRKM